MNGCSGIILAGGRSRRMGQDKSLMALGGRTLAQRAIDALMPICDDIVFVTNTPDQHRHLGVHLVMDTLPGAGSLGGLYSGLCAVQTETAVAVACDMPFLNSELLRYLVSLMKDVDAVVPDLGESEPVLGEGVKAKQIDLHPLHAVYSRACVPAIGAQVSAGDLRMIGFLNQVRVRYAGRAEVTPFDPRLRSFFNINTPEDWGQAQMMDVDR